MQKSNKKIYAMRKFSVYVTEWSYMYVLAYVHVKQAVTYMIKW